MSFDADVVFGRRAYVSVRVLKLVGRARFQMCCKPFSHWSLSFYDVCAIFLITNFISHENDT